MSTVRALSSLALVAAIAISAPAPAAAGERSFTRSIRVAQSPADAQRVVDRMRGSDGMRLGVTPPGVRVTDHGAGRFSAEGAAGTTMRAHITVAPAAGGGAIVTEHASARSPLPGAATAATLMHSVATSLASAYARAASRRTR